MENYNEQRGEIGGANVDHKPSINLIVESLFDESHRLRENQTRMRDRLIGIGDYSPEKEQLKESGAITKEPNNLLERLHALNYTLQRINKELERDYEFLCSNIG